MYLTQSQKGKGEWYIATMNSILGEGVDIRTRSRRHDIVWGRYIVAEALQSRLGFTASDAARFLGWDHSSSIHWKKSIDTMQKYPVMYAYENELFIDFNSRI